MKIVRHGVVIITDKRITVEGWLMQPEASDPKDATPEQMTLKVAVEWAMAKLFTECQKVAITKAKANAAEQPKEN